MIDIVKRLFEAGRLTDDAGFEIERLRGLLREARDCAIVADEPGLIDRIDAALAGAADQPDTVPRAEYDRLQSLVTAQGLRLMETEDQPDAIPRAAEMAIEEWISPRPDAAPRVKRAYYETHEPPHCPSCRCGLDRHPGYVIGNHWLESAYERICAGEAEAEVLADYGVTRTADNSPGITE